MKNLLLTGQPGVGKTTLIQRALEKSSVRAHGFYTAEIRKEGKRTGFAIRSLDGEEGTLASVDLRDGPRVGRYGVNLADLERVGVNAILRALEQGTLVVIDEIGKMELLSEAFRDTVWRALESPCPVLGTITESPDPFAQKLKARPDVKLIRVTRSNRDVLWVEELLPWLSGLTTALRTQGGEA